VFREETTLESSPGPLTDTSGLLSAEQEPAVPAASLLSEQARGS